MPQGRNKLGVKKESLEEQVQSLDIEAGAQKSQVERLQKRIDELEKHFDEESGSRAEKQDWTRDCAACEHMIEKALENHPSLRELRDKFEKYHFKLIECRNENLLLRRELKIAKKVLCQELGIDAANFQYFLTHATEEGWKGRSEKVLALQQKNHNLENKLKVMEGKEEPPKASPSEEVARQNISEDRKAFWRMELEKKKGYEIGDKERSDLAAENLDLRRNLENSRMRVKELAEEIRMLKREIYSFSEKSRDDNIIIQSLQNAEQQLRRVLEDRSEMRRELTAERCRNKTLKEKIDLMKGQMEVFKDKSSDDQQIIDSFSCQNKRLQTMLESEQVMGHQKAERFKEEMKKMMANHSTNSLLVEKMQRALSERDAIVKKLQQKLGEITQYLAEKAETEAAKEEAELQPKPSKSQESKEISEDKMPEASAANGKEGEEKEEEEPKPDHQELQMDIARYKVLYEAAKDESQTLEEMICSLNKKVDDLNTQLLLSQKRFLQSDLERKELEDKINRLEKAVKAKKKKEAKPWEKESKQPSLPIPSRKKTDEMSMKLDVLMEENDFLRSFLANTIGSKEDDFHLYRLVAENAEKHFETTIEAMRNEFVVNKKASEEVAGKEKENEERPENQ